MPLNDWFMKLTMTLFMKSETIMEIRDAGDHYLVSVRGPFGKPAYHEPYIVSKDGEIIGVMKQPGPFESDTEFDNAKVIFIAK